MSEEYLCNDIYNKGMSMEGWLFTSGHNQAKNMSAVGVLVSGEPRVVETHVSKSRTLPVACYKLSAMNNKFAYVFLRDNFYDIKLVVIANYSVNIPYGHIHDEWSQERYESELKKYSEYPTDDILGPEKAQKRRDYISSGSLDWYNEDWSNGFLIRKDNKIYRAAGAQRVYCEGIGKLDLPDDAFHIYEDDRSMFGCAVGSYAKAAFIMKYIYSSGYGHE